MLDMVRIDGVDYYDTLAKSEYYAAQEIDHGEPAGKWGQGIEKIGLMTGQEVNGDMLRRVMAGFSPTGAKLVQNAGTDTMRVGMDLTFSAPKSVSVLWANAPDELREQISQAHAEAVSEAMEYMRQRVETRTGKNGTQRETPAALIFASFEHCDTREKDPNLHTHTVLSNAVVRENGKTSAIDQKGIYEHKLAAGTTYRAALARRMREIGFKTEADPKNAGIFQLAGMPKELEKHFSKRSEQIKAEAKATGFDSAQSRRNHAGNTRKAKEEIDRPALFERWQAESKERGFDASSIEAMKDATPEPFAMPTTAQMLERLTENESFFEVKDLEKILAECGQYHDFDREAKKAEILESVDCVARVKADYNAAHDSITTRTIYTAKTLIDLEQKSIDSAQARQAETRHHLPAQTVAQTVARIEQENGFTLRDEQREAVEHLTQKSGGVALLRGLAGTGKTTALKAVSEAFKAEGYTVHGATISAQAAQILSKETGLKGATIAQTLINLDRGKTTLTEKSVLLIDEAGMVGSRDFARLQAHADKAGAKVIAVGDERQLQAIASGGIFEALQRHAGLDTADLKTITRQQDAQDRDASRLLYEGKALEALKIYEDKGQIKTLKQRDTLMIKLASDYAQDPSEANQKMIITSTRAEARLLNEQAREELKSAGKLEGDTLGLFENAEGDTLEISKGDRIIFKKNSPSRGIVNNMRGTVKECRQVGEHSILKIECDDGKTREIGTADYNDMRHGYAITGHASQGATVQKSFVLFNRGASDLSWGYVAMTRHKDRVNLYATEADRPDLAEKFSKAAFKGTTLDLKAYEQTTAQTQAGNNATSPQASSVGNGQQPAGGQMPPTANGPAPAGAPAAAPAAGPNIGAMVSAATEAGLKIGRQAHAESAQIKAETALKNAAHNQEIDKWVKAQTQTGKQKGAEMDL